MQHLPMTTTVPTGRPYVSCIRIDGVPIMPPFMTDKRREEMRHYRDLAIARERQLHHARKCSMPALSTKHPAPIPTASLPALAATDRRLSMSELSANAPPPIMEDYLTVSRLLDQQQRFAMVTSMVAACCDSGGGDGGDVDGAATSSTCGADDDTTLDNVSDITTDQANEADVEENNDDDDDDDEGDGDSSTVQITAFVQPKTNDEEDGVDETNSDSTSAATLHSTIVIHSPGVEDFAESAADLTAEILERSSPMQMPSDAIDEGDRNTRPRLIRSNSYTLDTPSPAFLKHLQSQGVDLLERRAVSDATIAEDLNGSAGSAVLVSTNQEATRRQSFDAQSKHDRRNKTTSKFSAAKTKPASVTNTTAAGYGGGGRVQTSRTARRASFERVYGAKVSVVNVSLSAAATPCEKKSLPSNAKSSQQAQRLRRVYDPKPTPPKPQRPPSVVSPPVNNDTKAFEPCNTSPTNIATPIEPPSVAPSISPPATTAPTSSERPSDHNRIVDLIGRMETDRRRQMDELIARQEIEQRRLQEAFMQQQQLLVQQITANCSAMIESCQQNVAIQLARQSPVALCASPLSSNHAGNGDVLNNNRSPVRVSPSTPQIAAVDTKHRGTQRRLFVDDHDPEQVRAATCITAHVRGYLTRRLFRTEDVQTVVQVIRDTLLFVMDLYREQMDGRQQQRAMSDADVKLRRSLLQQLNSSCYMLHDIFIRKSVRDRMEIISTDRRIQQRRLEREALLQADGGSGGHQRTPVAVRPKAVRPMSSQQRHRMAQLAKITL